MEDRRAGNPLTRARSLLALQTDLVPTAFTHDRHGAIMHPYLTKNPFHILVNSSFQSLCRFGAQPMGDR